MGLNYRRETNLIDRITEQKVKSVGDNGHVEYPSGDKKGAKGCCAWEPSVCCLDPNHCRYIGMGQGRNQRGRAGSNSPLLSANLCKHIILFSRRSRKGKVLPFQKWQRTTDKMEASGDQNLRLSTSAIDVSHIVNGVFDWGQCCYLCIRVHIMPNGCQFSLQLEALKCTRIRIPVHEVFWLTPIVSVSCDQPNRVFETYQLCIHFPCV